MNKKKWSCGTEKQQYNTFNNTPYSFKIVKKADWVTDVKFDKNKIEQNKGTVKIVCKPFYPDYYSKTPSRTDTIQISIGNMQEHIIVTQFPTNKKSSPFQLIDVVPNEKSGVWTEGGWLFGYSLRGENLCSDITNNFSTWEQPAKIGGVQTGFKLNHFFAPQKVGLGFEWGLYGDYLYAKNKYATSPDNQNYFYNIQKVSVALPLHCIWKIDFLRNLSLILYGGVGVNFGLYGKVDASFVNATEPFYSYEIKPSMVLDNIDLFAEYGVGLQFFVCRIQAGLTNHLFNSGNQSFTGKQNTGFQVSLSIVGGKKD